MQAYWWTSTTKLSRIRSGFVKRSSPSTFCLVTTPTGQTVRTLRSFGCIIWRASNVSTVSSIPSTMFPWINFIFISRVMFHNCHTFSHVSVQESPCYIMIVRKNNGFCPITCASGVMCCDCELIHLIHQTVRNFFPKEKTKTKIKSNDEK